MVSRTEGCIVVAQEATDLNPHLDRLAISVVAFMVSLLLIVVGYTTGIYILFYSPLLAISLLFVVALEILKASINAWRST